MPPAATLSLLAQQMNTLQKGVDEIKNDVKSITTLDVERRMSRLESTVTWLSRTIGAAFISGGAAAAYALLTRH